MLNMYNFITDDIYSACTCDIFCYLHRVSTDCITGAVKHMKLVKSNGFDCLTSDSLKHGSPLLFDYL